MTKTPRSCRRATELISQSLDRELTGRERFALRIHLITCTPCRRFRRHLEQIRHFVREHAPRLPSSFVRGTLSSEARARIERVLIERDRS